MVDAVTRLNQDSYLLDKLVLICLDEIRKFVVLGVFAVGHEYFHYTFPSGNALRLLLAAELKRAYLIIFRLRKENQCLHIIREEADIPCICLIAGHLCKNTHETQDTISI